MTDEELEVQATQADQELAILKARADTLGISYKSTIGVASLRAKVKAKLEEKPDESDEDDGVDEVEAPRETVQQVRERVRKEGLALVRVRIANMNPSKADLEGELITTGNKFIGTITKMIPFGKSTDNGYHVPKIIYDDLVARQFQQVFLKKDSRGLESVQTRLVPEYNIQILPPLTAQELQELALQQQAAERLGA